MDMLLIWLALTAIIGSVAFVAGRKFGVTNVCHSGKVSYGSTWDGRIAVNIILMVNGQPHRFAIRVPKRASEKIAMGILDREDVEIDGGTTATSVTPLH